MKRRSLAIAGIVIGVLVLALVALPFLVNANSFRPAIESQLQSSLGRRVTIGDLSLGLLSGGITARDIGIADDPSFCAPGACCRS